jgi:WD40 repeat protein
MAICHSRNVIRLIDPATTKEVATLEAPIDQPVLAVCFSPDGSQLLISGGARGLQLWDLRALRRRLKSMHIDWHLPDYPPPGPERP